METVYKTRQELFDFAVSHMDKQRKPSVKLVAKDMPEYNIKAGAIDTCLYRANDGSKCIVGAMIDDEHYTPRLEGQNSYDSGVVRALSLSGFNINPDDDDYLKSLQRIHDAWAMGTAGAGGTTLEHLKEAFIKHAKYNNLDDSLAVSSFN